MSRQLAWTEAAWSDYDCWQGLEAKTLKRINKLVREVIQTPFEGIGRPEKLQGSLDGFWSRRIDDRRRLVYAVSDERITIVSCQYHYR